jgi:hypothetical protein
MAENDPITIAPTPDQGNPNISIDFEKNDLSVGTARYTAAKQISKNLSMKPNGPGLPDSPMVHSNVEVHLRDDQGHEVRMTRRLVRYWDIRPTPGAVVADLSQWKIIGLKDSDAGTPLPVGPGQPAFWNFIWDRPGSKDAPGMQIIKTDQATGQLQEFLVGNAKVGGAYFQVYTLDDGSNVRVINTRPLTLTATDYREVLRLIDSGEYSKSMGRKLFFMLGAATDNTTPAPSPGRSPQ